MADDKHISTCILCVSEPGWSICAGRNKEKVCLHEWRYWRKLEETVDLTDGFDWSFTTEKRETGGAGEESESTDQSEENVDNDEEDVSESSIEPEEEDWNVSLVWQQKSGRYWAGGCSVSSAFFVEIKISENIESFNVIYQIAEDSMGDIRSRRKKKI